jgi:hypothetical protein
MFSNALLDVHSTLTSEQRRFFSCVKLVADDCRPAVFYLYEDWVKAQLLSDIGVDVGSIDGAMRTVLEDRNLLPKKEIDPKRPKLVYLEEGSWDTPDERSRGLPVRLPDRAFVLSPSDGVNRAALADAGLNANTVLLCLAAVGVDLVLPNVSFDIWADEEIFKLRDNLVEERVAYLEAVSKIAAEAYDRTNGQDIDGLLRWAEHEVTFKVVPKARALERAAGKSSQKLLRAAGYSFWIEATPAIGAAYLSGGLRAASAVAATHLLQSLLRQIGKKREERALPEVGYAMSIKSYGQGRSTVP